MLIRASLSISPCLTLRVIAHNLTALDCVGGFSTRRYFLTGREMRLFYMGRGVQSTS
jgi:hypothetical protein